MSHDHHASDASRPVAFVTATVFGKAAVANLFSVH